MEGENPGTWAAQGWSQHILQEGCLSVPFPADEAQSQAPQGEVLEKTKSKRTVTRSLTILETRARQGVPNTKFKAAHSKKIETKKENGRFEVLKRVISKLFIFFKLFMKVKGVCV